MSEEYDISIVRLSPEKTTVLFYYLPCIVTERIMPILVMLRRTFCSFMKGVFDVMDERSTLRTTARISNRWPLAIFSNIFNVVCINWRIFLLFLKTPEEKCWKRSLYLEDLTLDLLKGHLQEIKAVNAFPLTA